MKKYYIVDMVLNQILNWVWKRGRLLRKLKLVEISERIQLEEYKLGDCEDEQEEEYNLLLINNIHNITGNIN